MARVILIDKTEWLVELKEINTAMYTVSKHRPRILHRCNVMAHGPREAIEKAKLTNTRFADPKRTVWNARKVT